MFSISMIFFHQYIQAMISYDNKIMFLHMMFAVHQ